MVNILFSRTTNAIYINKNKGNRQHHYTFMTIIDHVIRTVKLENIDIIFPLKMEDVICLAENRQILNDNNIKILLSDIETINMLNHKTNFYDFMIENNFSQYIPKKYDLIQYPCILKKNVSFYGLGSKIVWTESDLPHHKNLDIIKQEYAMVEPIYGEYEYATHVLAKDGEIILHCTYRFSQFNNKNIYIRGSGSKDQSKEVININDDIISTFRKVIKTLNYNGMCCFDYKIVDDIPKIFEINPRIGMSLMKGENVCKFIDKYTELLTY